MTDIVDGYLLDTCVVIPKLRGPSHTMYERVEAGLSAIPDGSPVAISTITEGELECGWELRRQQGQTYDIAERTILEGLLRDGALPIDRHTSRIHAKIRAALLLKFLRPSGKRGKLPEQLVDVAGKALGIDERDLLIVSTAIQYDYVLVTLDTAEGMRRIKEVVAELAIHDPDMNLRIREL